MTSFPDVRPLSEKAVAVTLGLHIDPVTHNRVLDLTEWLRAHPFPGLLDVVPAYASVTIHFDPSSLQKTWASALTPTQTVCAFIEKHLPAIPKISRETEALVEIPVHYGGGYGPDLPDVAKRLGLSQKEVVQFHSETIYRVYMIGFLPGFTYMGVLPTALVLPRRSTPRLHAPAGSVAIAGQQTGIYPQRCPGGWHLIGWTPVQLFDSQHDPPALLKPGDGIKFVSF